MSRSIEVVCTAFAEADDLAIAALDVPGRRATNHRPHLTLASARDTVTPTATAVAARHAPFPLVLDRVGTFGQVLWLGPRHSAELRELQRDVHASLLAAGLEPAFTTTGPDEWVPHCTLARGVTPAAAAAFTAGFEAIAVTVTGLAAIRVGGTGDLALVALGA